LRVFTEKDIPLTSPNYFDGVVQQLTGNTADLAMGYFNIREERAVLVTPLIPIMAERYYIHKQILIG
jgi:hypothetical protein